MNLTIAVIKNPTPKFRDELKEFSDSNWGKHVDSDEDIHLNFFLPFDIAVLAKDGNKKVGLIEIFLKKNAIVGKENIFVGGIGGVVVDRKYRHKGIATAMLKKTLEVLKKEKADIAMLCTEIERLGPLYKGIGFVPLRRPYLYTDRKGEIKEDAQGMVAALSSKDAFERILASPEIINVGPSNF